MTAIATKPKRQPHPAEIIARWIVKVLLLVGCVVALISLVGCASHPASSHVQRAAWPFEGTRMARRSQARAVTPSQWRTLRAEWLPSAGAEGYFVFHATVPSYQAMQLLGVTTNTFFVFQSQQAGFVGVKATNHVGISNWGIPKQ